MWCGRWSLAAVHSATRLIIGQDAHVANELLQTMSASSPLAAAVYMLRGAGAAWRGSVTAMATRLATMLRPRPDAREIRGFHNQDGAVHPLPLATRAGAVAPDTIAAAIGKGATIVFQKVDILDFHWHRLARAFECATGQPAQINIYAGAAGTRGLAWHRDPHDILLFQLVGEKSFGIEQDATPRRGRRRFEVRLRAGDLMWLGRGTAHRATNGSAGSVHAALGLHHLIRDPAAGPVIDGRQIAAHAAPSPLTEQEKAAALLRWRPFRRLPGEFEGGVWLRPDLLALMHVETGMCRLDLGGHACTVSTTEERRIAAGLCPPGQPWLGARLRAARSLHDLADVLDPGRI